MAGMRGSRKVLGWLRATIGFGRNPIFAKFSLQDRTNYLDFEYLDRKA